MNPQIRKLEEGDIERVYNLGIQVPEFSVDNETSHRFWSKNTLERFASQGFSLVIDKESSIVGFLLAVYQPVTQKLTWENMYLLPPYRKKGLAEECFKKSWELAQKEGAVVAECIVASNNIPSRKMCEKLDFNNIGTYQWMLKFKDN